MIEVLRDIRAGGRLLLKSPGYAAVVALTLALAIGANTIIFSFADLFLLRPLPLGDPARIVRLYSVDTQRGIQRERTSLPDFLDWRAGTTAFEEMAAFHQTGYTLTGSGDPLRVTALRATANMPAMWQLKTVAGRTLLPGEDAPGAPKVAVLSHRFWKEHFASDGGVVGRTLMLNGEPYTVVGVLTDEIEIGNMIAIRSVAGAPGGRRRRVAQRRVLSVSARLKRGATRDQAAGQLRTVAQRLERDFPATNAGWSASALTLRESIAGPNAWMILLLLIIVVVFVLIIACANVANMMLARATARSREMAVRLALGASRLRLVAQLDEREPPARGRRRCAGARRRARRPQGDSGRVERAVLQDARHQRACARVRHRPLALRAARVQHPARAAGVARRSQRRAERGRAPRRGGRRGRRSRAVLVVSQLALALMLLVVAGLITKTIAAVEHVPTGIDPSHVLTLQVQLDLPKYPDAARAGVFAEQFVERLRALPGVRAAAVTNRLPLIDPEPAERFRVQGQPIGTAKDTPWAHAVAVGGDYLNVFNIRLSAGRTFSARDNGAAPNVAMINREAARRYWGSVAPIGSRIEMVSDHSEHSDHDERAMVEIVGIVEDVKTSELTDPMAPRIYRPLAQRPDRAVALAVRTDGDPAQLGQPVRAAIRSADADLAVSRIQPLTALLFDTFRENRVLLGMFVAFALVALLMSGAGLYGVTAYAVSQRTQEIGIRMALGATAGDVLRMIGAQNARLVGVGAILGVLGGLGLGSLMRGILYGVEAADPATFAGVLAILTAVALSRAICPREVRPGSIRWSACGLIDVPTSLLRVERLELDDRRAVIVADPEGDRLVGTFPLSTNTRRTLVWRGSRYSMNSPVFGSRRRMRSLYSPPDQTSPFLSAVTS